MVTEPLRVLPNCIPLTALSMSASIPAVNRVSLPASVQALLRRVRYRLRRDATLTGLLIAICFVCAVFWGTTTLDIAWFRLQRLELPVGLRAILLAMLLPALLWLVFARVLFPLIRRVRDTDLAILLERKFPQFQDRLITSVESAHGLPDEGPLTRPMLNRSVLEADRIALQVEPSTVFDSAGLKRLGVIAGCLMLSIGLVSLAQPQIIVRWWNAFVRCDEVYHVRSTDLDVVVVSQPGDRRVEFQRAEERLVYRHPRGADLELEMSVPEKQSDDDIDWVVPDRVRVDIRRADGSRSRTYVTPTGSSGRTFRFVVTRLQEMIEIELLAGDYRTRVPYTVDVVNAPGIDSIQLTCNYPEYTGWNQMRETSLTVTGSEVQVPMGTVFQLQATSSKPLRAVRIVSDQFEYSGDLESSRLTLSDGRSAESLGRPLVAADGKTVTASFEVSALLDEKNVEDKSEVKNPELKTISIPSNTNLKFFLHDQDDVMSVSPETLRVQGIEDKPPSIVSAMTGVDNAITRLAKIPIAGRIRDDYGIHSAMFEFLVDDESTWRPRPFRIPVPSGSADFELRRSPTEPFELFDVQVLDLSEGQTLTLSLIASDTKVVPSRGTTRSEPMLFRIVSIEELLSLLYTREIGLRGRFEEVIKQLEELSGDLQFHQSIAERAEAAGASASQEDMVSLTTCATRSGNNLRRQTNELNSIAEGFEEVVKQLVNNAVPPQQLAENMRTGIVEPLRAVSEDMLPLADRSIGAFRVAAQSSQPAVPLIEKSRNDVQQVILSLRAILENVRDMAEFHEALRDLKAILDEQQKNLEQTKKLQKNQLIDDILK